MGACDSTLGSAARGRQVSTSELPGQCEAKEPKIFHGSRSSFPRPPREVASNSQSERRNRRKRGSSVRGKEIRQSLEKKSKAHPGRLEQATVPHSAIEYGWKWETDFDPLTGETPLEKLYRRYERDDLPFPLDSEQACLQAGAPRSSSTCFPAEAYNDGSISPHFFVGFSHYDYRLRDVYRGMISKKLNELQGEASSIYPVAVEDVKLSVGWSGRFNIRRFNKVRRVCGVRIRTTEEIGNPIEMKSSPSNASSEESKGKKSDKEGAKNACESLPDSLKESVKKFVDLVNQQKNHDLLSLRFFQASEAIQEIEFDISSSVSLGLDDGTVEERSRMAEFFWLREIITRKIIAVHKAVIVLGSGSGYTDLSKESKETSAEKGDLSGVGTFLTVLHHESSVTQKQKLRYLYEDRWLKTFHSRRVIPKVTSLLSLSVELACIVHPLLPISTTKESEQLRVSKTDVSRDSSLWNDEMRCWIKKLADAANQSNFFSERKGYLESSEGEPEDSTEDNEACKVQKNDEEALERQLLLFLAESCESESSNSGILRANAEVGSPEVEVGSRSAWKWVRAIYQVMQSIAGVAGKSFSAERSNQFCFRSELPIFFLHGAYGGGVSEMHYLQQNTVAMNAALLHPNHTSLRNELRSRRERNEKNNASSSDIFKGYRRPAVFNELSMMDHNH